MNMRKAFALVELLAAIMVIAVMSISVAALTRPLIIEIPRANRIMETNTSILNLLSYMRRDVEAAVCLPDAFGDKHTNDATLLIEQPNRIICYTLGKDEVVRKVLKGQSEADAEPDVWLVPKAKINWQRWQTDGRSYALEVGTHFEYYKQGSHKEIKLANNHVYFVGAAAEAICEK
jgi:type II secretory pathway component PulJ